MIPNTRPYYIFIRACIWSLRAVAPASLLYCLCRAFGYRCLPHHLETLAYLEALFWVCICLPRQHMLDRSSQRALQRTRQQRRELFDRCWASIPDMGNFVSTWFKDKPLERLCREDVKDFLAWGFLYKTRATEVDDDELEEYLNKIEAILDKTFLPGRGPFRPSQVSTDALHFQHRPLFFYIFAIGIDDLMTYATARWLGLDHYRLSFRNSLTVFPFRTHTAFSQHISPSQSLSYWHLSHTASKRLPILFIHGIGAGLRTYISFLREFMTQNAATDGQTGIIALEIMPISMRITRACPPKKEMLAEILKILDHHGWDRFVIAAHSYGSIIATHLLRCLETRDRISSILLVDPVTISIHWGRIPHNFIYRQPRLASEWQLQYFASTDMGIAHTITRRFDWSENVLWKDEIKGRTMTVVLSAKDIIVDTFRLLEYLSGDTELGARVYNARNYPRHHENLGRGGLDVLLYDHVNHAGVFDTAEDRRPLVDVLNRYCAILG